ncbi:RNA-directed DNA polymerase, eukaryota [Tanacetum coccineum]
MKMQEKVGHSLPERAAGSPSIRSLLRHSSSPTSPEGCNETVLWKSFAQVRRIKDVYLAKKKTIKRNPFGFSRFSNVQNPKQLKASLNTLSFGKLKLQANVARYQRNKTPIKGHTNQPIKSHTNHKQAQNITKPACIPTTTSFTKAIGKSFLNAVINKTHLPLPPPTPLIIHPCLDIINSLTHSLIGELAMIDTFPNLDSICEGLPPHAWHEAAFTRIAGEWGEVIFPKKCNPQNINQMAGKVCVRTKCIEIIQHNLPVTIDGNHVCVRVRELVGECDEIWQREKLQKLNEDILSSNNEDRSINDDVPTTKSDTVEDEDLYNDDVSNCDISPIQEEEDDILHNGGGWIPGEEYDDNCNIPASS